jgi:cAMP-dependent protein kinase regulator
MYEQKPKFGPVSFKAGEVIMRQGDIPDKFYIITSGQVEVIRHDDGQPTVINHLGVGEYFGEVGLVKWIRRIATIRALTDVELLAMDYQTFFNWLNRSPVLRQEIEDIVYQRMQFEDKPQPLPEGEQPAASPETADPITPKRQETAEKPQTITTGDPGGARFYPVGSEIIRQGDEADQFFIILEGLVEVYKTLPDGRKVHIARLRDGNYFGEIGIMENRKRMASVRALSDVRVVVFDRETFSSWLADSPSSKSEIEETLAQRQIDVGRLQRRLQSLPDSDETAAV